MNLLISHVLRDHVLLGGLVAFLLIPHWGKEASVVFWLSTIFIDLDHYVNFVIRAKRRIFDIPFMFRFHEAVFERRNRPEFLNLEPFHTLEFLLLVGLIAFGPLPILQPIFWGFVLHVVVDWAHLTRYRVFTKRAHTVVEYFLRRNKIRAQGMDPDAVFVESLQSLKGNAHG